MVLKDTLILCLLEIASLVCCDIHSGMGSVFLGSVSLEASFILLHMVLYMFSESVSDSRPVKRFCKSIWKRAATSGCLSCSMSGFGIDCFLFGHEKFSLIFVRIIRWSDMSGECSAELSSTFSLTDGFLERMKSIWFLVLPSGMSR